MIVYPTISKNYAIENDDLIENSDLCIENKVIAN